nr:MAG TPA: hypothetical protein [Caudoviricetes sp.]
MTNDLAAELKALIEEGSGYNQNMTIEPLGDGEWCSITTSSIDVCGDSVVIYARRMDGMNNCPDGMIELSDFGVNGYNSTQCCLERSDITWKIFSRQIKHIFFSIERRWKKFSGWKTSWHRLTVILSCSSPRP